MTQCRIILLLQPITKLYIFTIELKLRDDFRCFRSKICFRTFSTVPLNSPMIVLRCEGVQVQRTTQWIANLFYICCSSPDKRKISYITIINYNRLMSISSNSVPLFDEICPACARNELFNNIRVRCVIQISFALS